MPSLTAEDLSELDLRTREATKVWVDELGQRTISFTYTHEDVRILLGEVVRLRARLRDEASVVRGTREVLKRFFPDAYQHLVGNGVLEP
jgi:hypothetical protein